MPKKHCLRVFWNHKWQQVSAVKRSVRGPMSSYPPHVSCVWTCHVMVSEQRGRYWLQGWVASILLVLTRRRTSSHRWGDCQKPTDNFNGGRIAGALPSALTWSISLPAVVRRGDSVRSARQWSQESHERGWVGTFSEEGQVWTLQVFLALISDWFRVEVKKKT